MWQQSSWAPLPSCFLPGSPPSKISCFISTRVSLENLILSVRPEPTLGPWKEAPFLQQECWSGLPCPPPWESSQLGDRTQVSCIAGGFFTSWATREAQECWSGQPLPFSRGSLQPRNWIGVSCIAGGFFTSWATRKPKCVYTSF